MKIFNPLKKSNTTSRLITILRHAETTWNAPKKKIQGQSTSTEIILSEKGRHEASVKLSNMTKPDILILSPLLRCKQTAEAWFGMSLEKIPSVKIFHDGLKEVDAGKLEGLYVDELQNKDKEIWQLWKKNPLEFPGFPNGETLQQFQARILKTFSEICNKYANDTDKSICIITHGGPIRILRCFLEKKDLSHLWDEETSNLEQLVLTNTDIENLKQFTLIMEKFPMKPSFFNKDQKIEHITYTKQVYPENHWARHIPNTKDKNFIAELKINGVRMNLKLNTTDARGYRGIVCLVTENEQDMPTTFNRKYSFQEKQALNTALNILASAYENYGMVVQTEIAGNNSQSITKDGLIQLGNEKEPTLLHGHIIGRGNPNTTYINSVPLRGPKAGELFNMRGDGLDEGNKSKEKWQTGEIEAVADVLAVTVSQIIESNDELNKIASIVSMRECKSLKTNMCI